MTTILHLPFPPSSNAAARAGVSKTGKAFVYSSDKKRKFFSDAEALYMAQKRCLERVSGKFTYHLILNEKLRHGNADGDNRGKYALDFAQKVGLIENDKLAEGGSWCWGPCEHGALLSIRSVAFVSEASSNAAGEDDAHEARR